MDQCPQCGEQTINYIGEAYDDEEHLGSSYECLNCDFHFVVPEDGFIDLNRDDYSTKF